MLRMPSTVWQARSTEKQVKRMCNAIEVEMAVTGDVNVSKIAQTDLKENGGKEIALGRRPSQPLKDFFVPVSQRDKAAKKLVDEVGKPPNPVIARAVEVVAKKSKGRPRKNSLEDDGREFFIPLSAKDRPKRISSVDAIGDLNPTTLTVAEEGFGKAEKLVVSVDAIGDLNPTTLTVAEEGSGKAEKSISSGDAIADLYPTTLTVAEEGSGKAEKPKLKLTEDYGSDFFIPLSKKERLNKELFKEEATAPVTTTSNGAEDGIKKRGRLRKSTLESEGNTVKNSPSGDAEDNNKRKRGRPRKILLDDVQDIGVRKQGRRRRKSTGEEGNVEDVAKRSASLAGAVTSSVQLHESQVCAGVVSEPNVSQPEVRSDAQAVGTVLTQNCIECQGQETQIKEGMPVARDSGSMDLPLAQGPSGDDFFMPASKRRKRKGELIDKKPDEIGNAPSKRKAQKDGQSEKRSVEGVTKLRTVLGKENKSFPSGLAPKEPASSLPGSAVPRSEHDLRLEAVLAAQENARLNAGKTTHPFFARKKASSLKTAFQGEEGSTFLVDDLQPGPPMHVTQLPEDERTEMVWSDWNARPTSINEETGEDFCNLERKRSRFMELFDLRPDWDALSTDVTELPNSGTEHLEESNSDGNEIMSSLKALQDLRHMQTTEWRSKGAGESALPLEDCQELDADLSLENLKDRLSWYNVRHDLLNSDDSVTALQMSKEAEVEALPSNRNLLWTDMYQPRLSKEVCGNTAAVEGLNTWLNNWQLKITGQPIKGEDANKGTKRDGNADYDSDRGWLVGDSENDSDSGESDDDTGLHNTLLVTGPEGCGKSAAVYACAGEQGFTVIEVNASDCRNGALIKQKFGEAMESHGLGKGSQVGVESPQPASKKALTAQESSPGQAKQNGTKHRKNARKKALTAQESSPGQAKQNGTKHRKLNAEKKVVDRSPIKVQPERLMASQDGNQMDSQSKRKTVILFEDVEKHFDEDKGFLTALVQLSKTTKRPIILTSNRSEPGLPPALEKCRVDFDYPASEELVLHACMVAIAERFPCSPLLLERLVVSCHNDLRKVMMALQFWGQGNAPFEQPSFLSRPAARFVEIPNDVEHDPLDTHDRNGKLSLEQEKSRSLDKSSNNLPLPRKRGKGSFEQWQSDARWLFELDVHHFILPKVISGSFACPLTLLAEEKISTAVRELEEYMEDVAATQSEERARAQQLEYESLEPARKALKREKDALRKASQSSARVPVDGGGIDRSPDEDAEAQNLCDESWASSPVKSLREAKTLARSPLKPKVFRSRRALLLCDSDDEGQRPSNQPEKNIEASNQSISDIEAPSSGVQIRTVNSPDGRANVVRENLEDTDIIHSSISESLTKVRRKRLSKKNSTLETGVARLKSLADITGEVPNLKAEPLGIQTDEIVAKSQFVGTEVIPPSQGSGRPLPAVDDIDRLITEPNTSISIGCKPPLCSEIGGQPSIENFARSGENQTQPMCSSGGEGLLENSCTYTTALQRPAVTEKGNHVNNSGRMSNPRLQSSCGEVLQNTKDALLESGVTALPGDISLPNISEVVESTGTEVALRTDLAGGKAAEQFVAPIFEPVRHAWESLRASQQTSKSLLNHSETSANVISSLAELSDIISSSDVIACVEPEEYKDARRNFDGTVSEAFEGNIGHSSDWDGCQEVASQLVCTGLQLSLPFLPAVNHSDYRLPVFSCVLECAMDAPAVGRCIVTHAGLVRGTHPSSKLHGMVNNVSANMNSTRQADRQGRLEDVVQAAVVPRGRVSKSAMVEYSAYLSRMSQLEETRRSNGLNQGRRPRRFEHHLTSKLKSLSSGDITELLKYSSYKSS